MADNLLDLEALYRMGSYWLAGVGEFYHPYGLDDFLDNTQVGTATKVYGYAVVVHRYHEEAIYRSILAGPNTFPLRYIRIDRPTGTHSWQQTDLSLNKVPLSTP